MQAVMTQKITERAASVSPRSQIARRADAALLELAHSELNECTRRAFKVIPRTHGHVEEFKQTVLVDYIPVNTPVDV